MNKNLLIIFYRNPELGKVKTRLAATLGDDKALAIYVKLVSHTRSVTQNLDVHKIVSYSHHVDKEDSWSNEIYEKKLQQGDLLGERIRNAIKGAFDEKFESVIVIGSDCFELTETIIKDAFQKLNEFDAVLGPAKDGGYYLLGSKKFIPQLFENKDWSTSKVAEQTLSNLEHLGMSYYLLPELTDVDTEEDLPKEILSKLKN